MGRPDPERERFVADVGAMLAEKYGENASSASWLHASQIVETSVSSQNTFSLIAEMYNRHRVLGRNVINELALKACLQALRPVDLHLEIRVGRTNTDHFVTIEGVIDACDRLGLRLAGVTSVPSKCGLDWLTELNLQLQAVPDHRWRPGKILPGHILYGWPVKFPSITGATFADILAKEFELGIDTSLWGAIKESLHMKGSVSRLRSFLERSHKDLCDRSLSDVLMVENPCLVTAINQARAEGTAFIRHIWIDGLQSSIANAIEASGNQCSAVIERGSWKCPAVYNFLRLSKGMPWAAMDHLCNGLQMVSVVVPGIGSVPEGAVRIGEIREKNAGQNPVRFEGAYRF